MHNDIFTIGKFTIHGYGLMIAIGVIVAVLVAIYRAKKAGIDPEVVLDLVLIGLICGFGGGKILYLIVEWKDFIKSPMTYLGGGGFVVYGGIILALIVGAVYFNLKKKDPLIVMDLIMPEVSIAQGFGRIGCFLAGCCYGRITDSVFGVVFPEGSLAPAGVKLIPTQLIMSAGNFLIAGILLIAATKLKKRGQILSLYLILYAIGRFAVEFLRNDHRGAVGVFSTSQFISLFIVIIGIGLFVWSTIGIKFGIKEEPKA
ncbi:MAG: prolipoprotein diacylglyceryl transferase [Lachnospiraceae bacterium]|nr:prolipoprotein diacylglyceryl transferase [Lachnospiraceae bacterium]